jgi:hypothetical protein
MNIFLLHAYVTVALHVQVFWIRPVPCRLRSTHRLNMEIDLQSLFGLHVHSCTYLYLLAEAPQLPPPRYWSAKIDDISL